MPANSRWDLIQSLKGQQGKRFYAKQRGIRAEGSGFLGCDAVSFGEQFLPFRTPFP